MQIHETNFILEDLYNYHILFYVHVLIFFFNRFVKIRFIRLFKRKIIIVKYDDKEHKLIRVIVSDRFHHQALVEVKILDALRRRDKDNQFNIIHMGEYFYFRNHLCITFELMGYVYLYHRSVSV